MLEFLLYFNFYYIIIKRFDENCYTHTGLYIWKINWLNDSYSLKAKYRVFLIFPSVLHLDLYFYWFLRFQHFWKYLRRLICMLVTPMNHIKYHLKRPKFSWTNQYFRTLSFYIVKDLKCLIMVLGRYRKNARKKVFPNVP